MQEASFVGLLKTIIWIIGVYYFVKIVAKLLMPILLRKVMEKTQDNLNRQFQQSDFNHGQTTYNQEPEKQTKDFKKPTKQVGEYVDFEEVKD